MANIMFTKEELIEIRNLIDGSKDKLTDETSRVRNSIASKIFSKLHSHPQEEPVSEDLEKELDRYLPSVFNKDMDGGNPRFTTWFKALRKTAHHFASWQKQQMMKDAFTFEDKHNTACILASECLRNHGWFNRERDFNNLWRFISGVNKLFEGEFKTDDKVKLIIIKED